MKKLTLLFLSLFSTKTAFAQGEFDDAIGRVDVPKGVSLINTEAGSDNIGILLFFSKLIQIVTVVAGIMVVINIILAAFIYLTGEGKADSHQKVKDKFTMSILGLIIIVSSYTIAGLIGLIFFGDASFIINPTIEKLN